MRIRLKVVAALVIMGAVVTGAGFTELAKPVASQLSAGVPMVTNASAAQAGKPFTVYAIVVAHNIDTGQNFPDPGNPLF